MTLRIEKWTLGDLATQLGARLTVSEAAGIRPRGVSTDSRTLNDGAIFVALAGESFDGHAYVAAAADRGACAAIVARPLPDVALPQLVVGDTLRALQALGASVFADARADGVRSIALTGSNGKTTTKELIAAVWASEGERVYATKGNFNNHIGVPLTLCAIPADARVVVIEMGANKFGDIDELVRLAPADVRIITSIGYAHIENLGDLDGVRRVKSEIFHVSDRGLLAVVPESERMLLWLNEFAGPVATVGSRAQGGSVRYHVRGEDVCIEGPGIEYRLNFRLPGAHNQHNLATAIATLLCGDWRPSERALQDAIDAVELPGGRWRTVRRGPWTVLDDAYNANPSSVRASWDAFVEIAPSDEAVVDAEIVAVLGEMFELGEEAEQLHRQTAAWMARRGGANAFLFVGRYARAMADAAREVDGTAAEAFDEPEGAARWLAGRPGGLVYLKASRGQKLERIIEHLPD